MDGKNSNKYEKVLNFIESKRRATQGEIKNFLKLDEETTESIISELCGKDNNWLIKHIQKPHKNKDEHLYEITIKGIEYLRNIQQTKFNKLIALTSGIIAMVALVNLFFLFVDKLGKIIKQFKVITWILFIFLCLVYLFTVFFLAKEIYSIYQCD